MELEQFTTLINKLKETSDAVDQLYKLNVNLIEFVDSYHQIISSLLEEIYGKEGLEWIEWFCWENDFGKGTLTAQDADGNPICYDIPSLWTYLEENKL